MVKFALHCQQCQEIDDNYSFRNKQATNVDSIAKIFVVDDDSICLQAVKILLLDNYYCEVDTADSVDQALNRIYEMNLQWQPRWYDLVLMDINLPIFNGDVLTQIIKKTETNMQTIPVIAITNEQSASKKDSLFACGITDVIIKPVTIKKLNAVMKKQIDDVTLKKWQRTPTD